MGGGRITVLAVLGLAGLASLSTCHMRGIGGPEADEGMPSFEERVEEAAEELVEKRSAEEDRLDDRFYEIGTDFDGFLGIAMVDVERGRTVHFNGEEAMPQQSLSKLWVALTAFDQADRGDFDVDARATVTYSDLTLFHQPLRKSVVASGSFTTDYIGYIRRALTESDNTANDMVLKGVGGPQAVRDTLSAKGLDGIRFGPGERSMQSAIAGLEWDQRFSLGKTFFDVRRSVPHDIRQRAFDAYVADPVDGARPAAIARALARLARGELLSSEATARFLGLLGDVKSGPNRLKGGLPPGWSIAHKTGTGQVLDTVPPGVIGEQAGYNDVGILTAPDGSRYAVVVMIGRTRRPVPERMDLMHRVVGAVAEYHVTTLAAEGEGRSDPPASSS